MSRAQSVGVGTRFYLLGKGWVYTVHTKQQIENKFRELKDANGVVIDTGAVFFRNVEFVDLRYQTLIEDVHKAFVNKNNIIGYDYYAITKTDSSNHDVDVYINDVLLTVGEGDKKPELISASKFKIKSGMNLLEYGKIYTRYSKQSLEDQLGISRTSSSDIINYESASSTTTSVFIAGTKSKGYSSMDILKGVRGISYKRDSSAGQWDDNSFLWYLSGNNRWCFKSDVSVGGSLNVLGDSSVGGNTKIGGDASIGGFIDVKRKACIGGDASINGNIKCGGSTIYIGPSTISVNSGGNFTFDGGIYSTSYITAGAQYSSSDSKLKDNITPVDEKDAIETLLLLEPKEWIWNENAESMTGIRGAGFVAQDIEKVIPYAISKDGEYLAINYNILHAFEVAAIKSYEGRIRELESEIDELKNKIKQ